MDTKSQDLALSTIEESIRKVTREVLAEKKAAPTADATKLSDVEGRATKAEAEIVRLTDENEQLKTQLAESVKLADITPEMLKEHLSEADALAFLADIGYVEEAGETEAKDEVKSEVLAEPLAEVLVGDLEPELAGKYRKEPTFGYWVLKPEYKGKVALADRVTKEQLQSKVEQLRQYTKLPLRIGWAYGRPRVTMEVGEHGGESDLSPRLPTGQMWDWLEAFGKGFDYGKQEGKS